MIAALEGQDYLASERIATVAFLALKMHKPVLVEGPAGVGKTELAKALAAALGWPLTRLQCYEGLDESKALYEWEYAKQLLYTQILRDKIGQTLDGAQTLAEAVERVARQDDIFYSDKFLLPRPLLKCITMDAPNVLLIDEIDKSDAEFEAFLLEVLSDFSVSLPEIGTIRAKQIPMVFLTSNNARELSDALKRRCLHLWIDFPARELEERIVKRKSPGSRESLVLELVEFVQSLRKLPLKKLPSISETLDWARALVVLNAADLTDPVARASLNTLLKYEGDIRKGEEELDKFLTRLRQERLRNETPGGDDTGDKTLN